MKQTYYGSLIIPVTVFVVGSLWGFIELTSEGAFWASRLNYLEGIAILGGFCLLCWTSMMIEIDPPTMTRRFFFLFPSTHDFSEVERVNEVRASDIYGTDRFMQIRFKNGDKWYLAMFSKEDVTEILETIRKHQKLLRKS
jgi:hypothetical protein